MESKRKRKNIIYSEKIIRLHKIKDLTIKQKKKKRVMHRDSMNTKVEKPIQSCSEILATRIPDS